MESASAASALIDRLERHALVHPDDLADTLERAEGDADRAVDLLASERILLPEQARRIHRASGRVVATCFICLKKTPFDAAAWTGRYFCEHCYKSVSVEARTAGFDDELLLDPAERVIDELVLRRLMRRQQVGPAAIEEARTERQTLVPRPPVWQVLVKDGSIDATAAAAVVAEVTASTLKTFPELEELRRDALLARRLLRAHGAAADKLSGALQRQLEAALSQKYLPLAPMLVEMGELSEYQATRIVPPLRDAPSGVAGPFVLPVARIRKEAPPAPRPAPPPRVDDTPLPAAVTPPEDGVPHKGIGHGYKVGNLELSLVGLGPARVQIQRVRDTAQLPALGPHAGDAGLDLYADQAHEIAPGQIAAIPLGIATAFPAGVVALIQDRSGLARRGLHALGGVIDAGYRGEWVAVLANLGAEPIRIEPGDRVAQALFVRLASLERVEVDELPGSERGTGGFGSTGR